MANGYFERGEVYGIRMDSGFGSEQGYFRPGVIISNNHGNSTSPTVNVAFTTTKPKDIGITIEINATRQRSWVLCNQIATVDKSRIAQFMGVLSSKEMVEVDKALGEVFDLGYTDDTALKAKDKEIEARDFVIGEKDAEIAKLQEQLASEKAKHEDELSSYKIENAMWQRLYEKALNTVVDMKFAADMSRPRVKVEQPESEVKQPEPPKEPETPKPPVVEESEEPKVDINHCTATRLKKLGFSLPMAKAIIGCRPFKDVDDLKRVPGLKTTMFRVVEPKLCCTPIVKSVSAVNDPGHEEEPKPTLDDGAELEAAVTAVKVNVNTATGGELIKKLGMYESMAYSITGYRNKNGKFATVAGKEYTVAEAIDRKNNGLTFLGSLMRRIAHDHTMAKNTADRANGSELEVRADGYIKALVGNSDMKGATAEVKRMRDDFIASQTMELIDPIGALKVVEDLDEEINAFMTNVDAALSVSNALTKIEISY